MRHSHKERGEVNMRGQEREEVNMRGRETQSHNAGVEREGD